MDAQTVYLILYMFLGYLVGAIVLVVFLSLRHRGKIRANVLTKIQTYTLWFKPLFEGDKIYGILRKENQRRNTPEWKAELTQVHNYKKRLGRLGREIYIYPEAPKTITFDFERKIEDRPMWDKHTSQEFINAKVLKREGEGLKPPIPNWILYVTLLFVVVCTIFTFLSWMTIRGIR